MAVSEPDSTGTLAVKGPDSKGIANWLAVVAGALADIPGQERARLTVWAPMLLVIGIWSYFAASSEPGWTLVIALAVAAALGLWRFRDSLLVMALVISIAGFGIAKLRTGWVATPMVRAFTPDVKITGYIADVDRPSAKRLTLVIDVEQAVGLPQEEVPKRVRIQATGVKSIPQIGDSISGTALLLPSPLPVSPGAFDYGRSLFFQSVGATGRFTSPIVTSADDVRWPYHMRRGFHALRSVIGERVTAVIEGPSGSFADALITGERAQIPKVMNDSLQASGLFHILSISGLHMAMVAGSAFWLVRALLALSPGLALRRPIKKWAAGVALAIGLFYMLLADGGAATERSFIMIAVMFFAVMVDRPAISLHNLAVAAIFILVLQPEQAVAASFQMSFLAVMGLAAFFEWWNRRIETTTVPRGGRLWKIFRRGMLLLIASLATSVIAGTLSGIPAAHHFGRLAPYGVVANALALPVVSVAVMPMALLATLAMPFGLEALPLWVMEQGLRVVMLISDWVAGWPAAGATIPLLSASTSAALAFAAAFATTARSALRWLAFPAIASALWFGLTSTSPDILVEERARIVAAVTADEIMVPTPGKGSRFAVGKWLQQRGQQEKPAAAAKHLLWTCEASVCRAVVKGRDVAFLKETAELVKPCPAADILIAQYPLRRRCKGRLVTIDRFDVWRSGAHAISLAASGVSVTTARGEQGIRPWTISPRARSRK